MRRRSLHLQVRARSGDVSVLWVVLGMLARSVLAKLAGASGGCLNQVIDSPNRESIVVLT